MVRLLATAAAAAFAVGSYAYAAESPMVGGAPMFADRTIVENAVNSADHTTLVAAVQAAGLAETLMGAGPFTVFAPTNDAFAKLRAGTVETLLKPENRETLVKILSCHVAAANAMASDIMQMSMAGGGQFTLETVGGCAFTVMARDGAVMIRDGQGNVATVTIADVRQSNGVIHVIDTVLLPAM